MKLEQILVKAFNRIKTEGASDLSSKNISKGDLGMEVQSQPGETKLMGSHYWYYLVCGRKPGKQPPMEAIQEWIRKKGISREGISERSLAFLIARKIGRFGTDIYMGKRPAWSLPIIIERNMTKAQDEMDAEITKQVDAAVMKSIDKIFGDLSTPRYSIKQSEK